MASTGDLVGNSYFDHVLNTAIIYIMPSVEGQKFGQPFTQADDTNVVTELLVAKALKVDEVRPKYLGSLDAVGQSLLTRFCRIA